MQDVVLFTIIPLQLKLVRFGSFSYFPSARAVSQRFNKFSHDDIKTLILFHKWWNKPHLHTFTHGQIHAYTHPAPACSLVQNLTMHLELSPIYTQSFSIIRYNKTFLGIKSWIIFSLLIPFSQNANMVWNYRHAFKLNVEWPYIFSTVVVVVVRESSN